MQYTEAQVARVKKDWERIAKEEIRLEVIGGAVYAFCSELAALRLFYAFRYTLLVGEKVKAEYSENQQTWFFRLEIN